MKNLTEELQEREKRLSLIYNSTNDLMALFRVEGKHFIIESVNRVFFESVKDIGNGVKDQEELEEMHFGYFLAKVLQLDLDTVQYRLDKYTEVLKEQRLVQFQAETQIDGRRVINETHLTPIFTDGEVSHILSVGRDVTEFQENVEKLGKLTAKLAQENTYLREEIHLANNYENMVYQSAEFEAILQQLEIVAATDATVLIQGETGTGKELIARAIHNRSPRKERPLIKVNCAAFPRDLIESELFGHEKGSFTGAIRQKLGKFELAHQGSIFLDEIGEMPLELQPKILRALQEGEFERVGGNSTIKVDVRVIAATNRDLLKESEEGNFRQDLYYRLNVFPISLPALRERPDDIPLLAEFFVDKFDKKYKRNVKFIPDEAMQYLREYPWPGNIRELENLMERSVILSIDQNLHLPNLTLSRSQPSNKTYKKSLQNVVRNHIENVLRHCDWIIDGEQGAAAVLDIKPSTLRDRMKKMGIVRPE